MNVVERGLRWADRLQQRSRLAAFVFAVIKKFGDDRASSLAVTLTYYGFLSIFPLLLVMTTILGFVGNERLSDNIIGTTLSQFPVFGEQLGKNAAHPLSGNGFGLVVGLLVLLYGALGFASAAQHAMAQVWNVPGVHRPGYFPRLARGPALLRRTRSRDGGRRGDQRRGDRAWTRNGRPRRRVPRERGARRRPLPRFVPGADARVDRVPRDLVPGAVLGGVGYSILLALGTALIQRQLRHSEALYGQFAFVLGLIAWLYLVSQLTMYAAELNVVAPAGSGRASILQPPLTEATTACCTTSHVGGAPPGRTGRGGVLPAGLRGRLAPGDPHG